MKAGTELSSTSLRIAIQGELGSNSHTAASSLFATAARDLEVVPCAVSATVFELLLLGPGVRGVDAAVLPIENSLHGSVAEHYDLLLKYPVRIVSESLLRIRFNLIAMPGVSLPQLRRVLSHPVALAQCRRFLAGHPELEAVPFYDTAGSVKHLMAANLKDTAGIAPEMAASQYGAAILERDLEDNPANFTRFHVLRRTNDPLRSNAPADFLPPGNKPVDKMTCAFSIENRPGSLVEALQRLSTTGVDLTRVESRPVPGSPWEYVFYVEFRFHNLESAEAALQALRAGCSMVKELGRYVAA